MSSSRSDEVSLILPAMENSLFTYYLLEAFKGGAISRGDGLIRVFDLFHYVSEKVPNNGDQHPIFKASDLENNFPVALYLGGKKISNSTFPRFFRDESKKSGLAIFKHAYQFAIDKMHKSSLGAEEFAKCLDKYSDIDFQTFKGEYQFAIDNMYKSSLGAEVFAKVCLDKYSDIDFQTFKDSYQFAINNMNKSSLGAEEFAKVYLDKYSDIDFQTFKGEYQFAIDNMYKSSLGAEKFAFEQLSKMQGL